MLSKKHPMYLQICIGYRIFTLLLSTIVYLLMCFYFQYTEIHWGILLGMTVSCLLSSWIYLKIEHNTSLIRIMSTVETLVYGIFTILSGGLTSPYLWYQMSSTMLMISIEKNSITILTSLWCIFCAFSNLLYHPFRLQELNIALAVIIILIGFFILRFYINFIENQKKELITLNLKLEKEKSKNEFAFLQLAELYESFHLFAMTNPDKIIHELALILHRLLAPTGCILIKLDAQGNIDRFVNCKIDENSQNIILGEIGAYVKHQYIHSAKTPYFIFPIHNTLYEGYLLGNKKGVFIRLHTEMENENEKLFWKLTEIIFSNLDSHDQLENFIAMEEQNRIANEIHDTVIQKLFGMVCKLKILETQCSDMDTLKLKDNLNALKTSVELTMAELRESIYGNRFNDTIHTFVDVLKLYMEEAQHLNGVAITLEIDEDIDQMTPAQKIAIYRISCEAVNNSIRHGKATAITVILQINSEQISLQIQDNGSGISKKQNSFYEGNGLKNMHNIAVLLKGNLQIESILGKGTKIKCVLPR